MSLKSSKPSSAHADVLARAVFLHQTGNLNDAEALYRAVLGAEPDNAAALYQIGMIHGARGQWRECAGAMSRVVSLTPAHADAHYNRGVALEKLEAYGEALASYEKAIKLKPDYPLAYNNQGVVLYKLKQYAKALASYDKAIKLRPDFVGAHNNRGAALETFKRYEDALAAYDKAIALKPDFVEAHNNRGLVLEKLHRYDEALAAFDQAIALKPDHAHAYWNKGLLKILLGEFEEGWKLYEWRWKRSRFSGYRSFAQPLWLGEESIAGKTLLLHAEQGLGDTLQFCRYVPMLEKFGAKIILEMPGALMELASTLKGSFELVQKDSPLPAFDMQCPLISLPLIFKTRLETIPAQVPYLSADPQKRKAWQEKLRQKRRPRIGLVWSGNVHHQDNHNRIIALRDMKPLWQFDCDYHALQKKITPEDTTFLARHNIQVHADDLHDFSDTAALIEEMDLVISVDTSVAHAVGALGKPLWVLLPYAPDYRWMTERKDSPWYPTARLFRQSRIGQWSDVIAKMAEEIPSFLK